MTEEIAFQPDESVTSDDKLWALLSYILSPIVPIILLLMEDKKNRPFIKYHSCAGSGDWRHRSSLDHCSPLACVCHLSCSSMQSIAESKPTRVST